MKIKLKAVLISIAFGALMILARKYGSKAKNFIVQNISSFLGFLMRASSTLKNLTYLFLIGASIWVPWPVVFGVEGFLFSIPLPVLLLILIANKLLINKATGYSVSFFNAFNSVFNKIEQQNLYRHLIEFHCRDNLINLNNFSVHYDTKGVPLSLWFERSKHFKEHIKALPADIQNTINACYTRNSRSIKTEDLKYKNVWLNAAELGDSRVADTPMSELSQDYVSQHTLAHAKTERDIKRALYQYPGNVNAIKEWVLKYPNAWSQNQAIAKCWETNPSWDVMDLYLATGSTPEERLKKCLYLVSLNEGGDIGHISCAQNFIACEQWEEAQKSIECIESDSKRNFMMYFMECKKNPENIESQEEYLQKFVSFVTKGWEKESGIPHNIWLG